MLTNWLLITPLPPSPLPGVFWDKWLGIKRLRGACVAKVVILFHLRLKWSKHSGYGRKNGCFRMLPPKSSLQRAYWQSRHSE